MITRVLALLSVGILTSSAALAADNGVYLGAAISQSSVDAKIGNSFTDTVAFDDSNTKFKIIGGVRPLDWLAFEVNYVDFGSVETAATSPAFVAGDFKLKGYDAAVLGLWEFAIVDIFGKAGVVRWNSDSHRTGGTGTSITNITDSDSGYDALYGGGVQVHLGSLSVRAEYEKFNIANTNDVSLISLGLTWTFL